MGKNFHRIKLSGVLKGGLREYVKSSRRHFEHLL